MLAAVRVRGIPDTRKRMADTLRSLRLHNKHNCMLYPDTESTRGMLQQAKDYIAYGAVSDETAERLLAKRGTVHGNPLAEELDTLGYDSVADVVAALADEDISLGKLHSDGLQVPFRLSPPSKGFKDGKRHYNQGGSVGKRDDMDELIGRMV